MSSVGAQTVAGRVPILLIGSNGLALDPQRRLVVTAMNDRTVFRLEKDGTRTVLADRYEGKRFNGPNDLVVKSNGSVYFTDTVWGLRGADKDPAREIPYSGTFLIRNGTVTLLLSDKDTPGAFGNGITLSPDEKVLYVTAGVRGTMRYDVLPDDTIANGRLFVGARRGRHEDRRARQPLHDQRRHAWHRPGHVARRQAARATSTCRSRRTSRGRACARPTSRSGMRTAAALYITACTHVFKIRMKVAGREPVRRSEGRLMAWRSGW